MIREKRKKQAQQKSIHDDNRKTDTLTPPTTQSAMKIKNQSDTI